MSGQSEAGSRNIFENLNRLLETMGPARRRVRVDTGRLRGADPNVEVEEVNGEEVGPFLEATRGRSRREIKA